MAEGGGGTGATIAGAASSAVGMIPALIGRGKNQRTASSFGQSDQYDPNAALWAGRQGAADAYAMRYQDRANEWQNQANQYGQQSQGLYAGGQASMGQQQQARGMQMDAASMARARATGAVPSIAQMQGDRAMGQVQAAQASQAASARGAAGLALAQQGAANNTANAQQNIAGQTQVAAAQERLAAENAYAQQAGAIRGGDQSAAQTQFGAGAQSGQLGIGAGGLGVQYSQAENDVRKAEMQAKAQQQATLAQSYGQSEQLNQQTANQNAQNKGLVDTLTDFFSDARTKMYLPPGSDFGGFGTLGGAMAGAVQQDPVGNASAYKLAPGAGMDVDATIKQQAESGTKFVNDPTGGMVAGARAEGGPVAGGQPYLVGEKGPEIVVPGQDGTVIPNHAISTWGSGAADIAAQDAAAVEAGTQANTAAFAAQEAANWKNPYQRDLDEINAQRNASRLLGIDSGLTADDRRKERVAKAFLKQPVSAEPEKPPEKSSVDGGPGRAPMWGEGTGQSSPDPPNAEAAMNPWLLALSNASKNLNEAQFGTPRRADGGPVKAGQPYMMGERGPEVVLPLSNPDGYELRQSEDGRGYYERLGEAPSVVPARFAAGLQSGGRKAEAPKAKAKPKADAVDLDAYVQQLQALAKTGPSVDAVSSRYRPADALAGAPYVYKDEFRPPEQAPGEVNYGPTAQTMQHNPVTATAVKRDPATGLLEVDANKLTKVNSSAIADLQKQIDMLALNAGGRR